MPAIVRVLPLWVEKEWKDCCVVSTVSRATGWSRALSPFVLGPCKLYRNYVAQNVENAWQYSKLYKNHADDQGLPTKAYWTWAKAGWAKKQADRYPMGKGKKPLCSIWDSDSDGILSLLTYVVARKRIYGPVYRDAVLKTDAWKKLKLLYRQEKELILLDFDAYDHRALQMTLTDVLNDPNKKMGHAFVLAMMLKDDPALKEFAE